MVRISINGDRVLMEVQGWDKLWALKSQLEFPLDHITEVRIDPEPARGWWHGLRFPGTNIPGVLTAGSFYQHDGAVFYDVHDPERTIVLELNHEHYQRLVVEVEDPQDAVTLLEKAMAGRNTTTE
jgi:hypothetical protein